jgi:hypothetical protein
VSHQVNFEHNAMVCEKPAKAIGGAICGINQDNSILSGPAGFSEQPTFYNVDPVLSNPDGSFHLEGTVLGAPDPGETIGKINIAIGADGYKYDQEPIGADGITYWLTPVPSGGGSPQSYQDNWRWCSHCQGLSFASGLSLGTCQAGGVHNHTGSGNYLLVQNSPAAPGQHNWRWCKKCQQLSFGFAVGICPAGGLHDHSGSGEYALMVDSPGAPGQHNWRWCKKCQVLAFAGSAGSKRPLTPSKNAPFRRGQYGGTAWARR